MGLFVGDSEPSKIFVGDTPISKVFLGDTQVRPSGWQPGANTIAYYPLNQTTTVNDMKGIGTAYNLSNNGVTFTTQGGVSCAYTTSGNYVTYQHSGALCGTIRTFSIWLYIPISTAGWMGGLNYLSGSRGDYGAGGLMLLSSNANTINVAPGDIGGTVSVELQNGWNNIIVTQNNNIMTMYVNGEVAGTDSSYPTSGSGTSPNCIRRGGKATKGVTGDFAYTGYFNEFIIENKLWTAQEISDYYNLTKSNYGL